MNIKFRGRVVDLVISCMLNSLLIYDIRLMECRKGLLYLTLNLLFVHSAILSLSEACTVGIIG